MSTGIVFDIQRFAIHDGPGIRTLVFLKGCPLRCLWCANPESQFAYPEIAHFESSCIKCQNCLNVCPLNAINRNDEVFPIDRTACNNCGKCAEVCYANSKKLIGKPMNVDDVLREVRKDTLFYRNSGSSRSGDEAGGMTISGGEPLMQPTFALELLRGCKQLGIHTVMETSGFAQYEVLQRIPQHLNWLYFDIKHMNPVVHKELTGVSNEIILENAKRIAPAFAKNSKRMIIRIPLIPGYNDDKSNLESTAEFVTELEGVREIEVLPYHNLGQHKYKQLGRRYELEGLTPPSKEDLQKLKRTIESHGLEFQIGT